MKDDKRRFGVRSLMRNNCLILSLILVFLYAFPGLSWSDEPVVTSIEIKGVKRIEEGSVKAKISQKIGEPLSNEKTSEDIKTIFKMGYFDDVKVEIEPFESGLKVTYIVKEKPTIIKIDYQGNKEFKDDKLKEKITLTAGAISDINLINENTVKLRAFYEDEGYYLAHIVPIVRKAGAGEVVLTYQIDEGQKVKIKEIKIEGNKALSSKQIKKVLKTKERWFLSFILGGGYYKKDDMKADIEQIRDLYYNNGYIKVTVAEPVLEISNDKKGMKIIIRVSEGDQFKVASVEITGNAIYKEGELRKLINLTPGKVFDKSVLTKDVTALSDKYSNTGYALVSVFPDLIPDEDKKTVKVNYKINEGDKYTVGKISISGNTKTRDKVIRREIRLDEGDTFDASALKRSYEVLTNTQFFETVDISPKPRKDEKNVDLDVNVKEKSTSSFSVGGGYSSIDGPVATASVMTSNLFGRGQSLKLSGELGGKDSVYELSFRDPWFLDKRLMLGVSIYKTYRIYPDYENKTTGFSVSIGKAFWEYYAATVAYTLELANIYNIQSGASPLITDQEGNRLTSAISPSLVRDTRDNYMDPSRGSRNTLSFSFAGLGGDNAYAKGIVDSGWYFPAFAKTTFAVRGRLGYATGEFGKEVPLYQRFYLGDINTIRGINFGDAGPRDINGNAIGGLKEIIINTEYIFPIVPEYKFKGLVFFDSGRAYDTGETFLSDLKYTTGFGIRWISPMGPIRVEWGYNLNRKAGEAGSKVGFTFGSSF
ncbi:MAG: outer membrane protein assembly factor BamA [Nitrospirae bacterium]|nr:outer membrane protein assembly factor BamA [Nitrospirota bacterium]